MSMGGGFVLEADIESFFDSVDRKGMQDVLRKRVSDGVVTRLIGKWLRAGVMEEGRVYYPESGTPQGGVISPLLANIYLHEVLDEWFENEVKPRLRGRAFLIRFADDFLITFALGEDARRVLDVLPKRFAKYGLRLHPEKTRVVEFRPPSGPSSPERGQSFNFLGFTHFWSRSRKGNWIVKRKTAKARLSRALSRVNEWMRMHRHLPVSEQHRALSQKLRGHYGYYGITGNSDALASFAYRVTRLWKKWLSKRSGRGWVTWPRFRRLLERFPLPPPRAVHSVLLRAANP
jgi:RNA-directed DNA polymerase